MVYTPYYAVRNKVFLCSNLEVDAAAAGPPPQQSVITGGGGTGGDARFLRQLRGRVQGSRFAST